jgi:hypothetical protein
LKVHIFIAKKFINFSFSEPKVQIFTTQ